MKASLEILYHMLCDHCSKWWTFGDIRPSDTVTCPHCGKQNTIESFHNGSQQEVLGVGWIYPEQDKVSEGDLGIRKMSLDVYLNLEGAKKATSSGIFIRENGSTKEISQEEWNQRFPDMEPVVVCQDDDDQDTCIYSANITHNLGKMAHEAGLYEVLWRPDKNDINYAHQLIEPLETGVIELKTNPDKYCKFNPENGWGTYEGLINFVEKYLEACKKYPQATVSVWR